MKVCIPQGAVLSPLLYNLYTGDASKGNVKSKTHSEIAENNTVVTHGQNINEVTEIAIEDSIENISVWCPKWTLEISQENTEVIVSLLTHLHTK